MAPKRTSTEADIMPLRPRRDSSKRTRLSPTAQPPSDSSDASTGSVSEASALQSTPGVSEDNVQSIASPISSQDDDETSESEMPESSSDESSSDEDEEDEDEEEEAIITLGGPKKPAIDPKRVLEEASKLQPRLQELMPKLRQANRELAEKGASASMEDVGDNEEHIEMNLGLGVLEEQYKSDGGGLKESIRNDTADEEAENTPDAMQCLLGSANNRVQPGIEEIDGV